jgi:hypothetical protein
MHTDIYTALVPLAKGGNSPGIHWLMNGQSPLVCLGKGILSGRENEGCSNPCNDMGKILQQDSE